MKQIIQYLTNLENQFRERFRNRAKESIDNIVFILQCESEILKSREIRYALAYDGSLGVQPTMKDSIRKPVVFPYNQI